MELRFTSVWYRSAALGVRNYGLLAMQDRGDLIVYDDRAEFLGKKERVVISGVRRVFSGRRGLDFVNSWVTIEYGNGQTAMVKDGSMLGWGGMLGGNTKIVAAISRLVRPA